MLLSWTLPAERSLETESREQALVPRTNLMADAEGYQLVVEMPGVTRENLQITLEHNALVLRGERPGHPEGATLLVDGRHAERPFERRFSLGRDIDPGKITAKLQDGLLYVTLPTKEETKPRKIEVEVR